MKALVTGATGFIGSHLAVELIKRGYQVTCLVRKTSNLRWIEGLDATLVYGDCEDEGSLQALPAGFDYIFHIAGLTKAKRAEDFFRANAGATENLLKTLVAQGGDVKRFLYLSSLAAVGPNRNGTASTEATEPAPVSNYGRSKLEGERITLRYGDRIPYTVIRPPAVYGPRDRDLFLFFKMVKRGFYPYWGKCYYSLLYVDDLVRGIVDAAEAKSARGGTFFLSDGMVYSNDEVVNEIAQVLDTRAVRIRVPRPLMTVIARLSEALTRNASIVSDDRLNDFRYPRWVCDAGKALREYGFTSKVTIKEGIKWTADWYRIHQWL
jgi:nucleoside-diphosphate-sugar epimerase